MRYRNLTKPCCHNCVYSSRLYAETSTKFGTFQFTEVDKYCYCTALNKAKPYTSKCKIYLDAYNNLENRLREEEPIEDNLPF